MVKTDDGYEFNINQTIFMENIEDLLIEIEDDLDRVLKMNLSTGAEKLE